MQDAHNDNPPEISLSDLDESPAEVAPTSADVPVAQANYSDALARVTDEKDQLKEENYELKRKLRTVETLDDLMKPSAEKAFRYMFVYSASVGIILLLNGFGCFTNPMDAEVLKFLVGSTAATVIGLVGMVLTGVFIGARK